MTAGSRVPPGAATPNARSYACGHSSRELRRLELQAGVYEAFTRRALVAAGLAPGMRVCDVGCGAGDLSLLAAELVAPTGMVVGVDRSPEAVAVARRRAGATGCTQVDFHVAALEAWQPPWVADAVVGRFVLMHQPDPSRLVARAGGWLRPGGLVVFLESNIAAFRCGGHSQPPSATYGRIVALWDAILTAAGAHLDMGARLAPVLSDAGLRSPVVLHGPGEAGGAGSRLVSFATESLRSLLPLARTLGLDVPDDHEADQLEASLRADLAGSGGTMVPPPIVAAWARTLRR